MSVLKEKQYGKNPSLTEDQVKDLLFLGRLAAAMPERSLKVYGVRPKPGVLYSDASWDEKSPPTTGWVLFDDEAIPQGRTLIVPDWVVASWEDRKTQIYPAETFAVYAALWNHRETLANKDVIMFVDNEAAASSIIRGAPRCNDVGDIVQAIHWLAANFAFRFWVEWIDSDSNPSDGLSRAGLADEWTREQGWALAEGILPPWDEPLQTYRKFSTVTFGF